MSRFDSFITTREVVEKSVLDLEEDLREQAQPDRARLAELAHLFAEDRHGSLRPVMDRRQQILFGADVVVERAGPRPRASLSSAIPGPALSTPDGQRADGSLPFP